jgi:hypothetical protein
MFEAGALVTETGLQKVAYILLLGLIMYVAASGGV